MLFSLACGAWQCFHDCIGGTSSFVQFLAPLWQWSVWLISAVIHSLIWINFSSNQSLPALDTYRPIWPSSTAAVCVGHMETCWNLKHWYKLRYSGAGVSYCYNCLPDWISTTSWLRCHCGQVTVMHSMQAGYMEKAQKYTDKAFMQIEKLRSQYFLVTCRCVL